MGLFLEVMKLYFVLLLILLAVASFYSMFAIGLSSLSKKLGAKNRFLAWLPIINILFLLKITLNKKVMYLFLMFLVFITLLFLIYTNYIEYITIPVAFIILIINIATYKLYKSFSKRPNILLIFSVLSAGLLIPVFLFFIKKNYETLNTNNKTIFKITFSSLSMQKGV